MKKRPPTPIFITGAQRSGSTIVAKIINLVGENFGKVSPMYENVRINELVAGYLIGLGINPELQYPLPSIDSPFPELWREKVSYIMAQENTRVYKSGRLCQMWRVWNQAFPDAKWIIVRRKTEDIVNSCLKTSFMRSFSDTSVCREIGVDNTREGWIWWVREHERMFLDMTRAGIDYTVIRPDRMAEGDYSQISAMLEWLGLPWTESIVPNIEPIFTNYKIKQNDNG